MRNDEQGLCQKGQCYASAVCSFIARAKVKYHVAASQGQLLPRKVDLFCMKRVLCQVSGESGRRLQNIRGVMCKHMFTAMLRWLFYLGKSTKDYPCKYFSTGFCHDVLYVIVTETLQSFFWAKFYSIKFDECDLKLCTTVWLVLFAAILIFPEQNHILALTPRTPQCLKRYSDFSTKQCIKQSLTSIAYISSNFLFF